jgi:hypothetical protein
MNNNAPMILLAVITMACLLLTFGGVGYFLVVVSATYWASGFILMKFRQTVAYGRTTWGLWFLGGVFWVLVTILAFRYANASLVQIIHLMGY